MLIPTFLLLLTLQAGLGLLRQLYFGAMDIELHSPNYDPFGEKTIFELQQEMASKYAVIPPLKDDRFLCSFGHIFAGGYSAGYYSYKWAGEKKNDIIQCNAI